MRWSDFVDKPWGVEEILVDDELRCLKRLTIFAGKRTSKQRHAKKDETLVAFDGFPIVEVWDSDGKLTEFNLNEIEGGLRIAPGTIHRICARILSSRVLEISTSRDDADVERLEDDHGRIGK